MHEQGYQRPPQRRNLAVPILIGVAALLLLCVCLPVSVGVFAPFWQGFADGAFDAVSRTPTP
jgi:hypothetical protein